MESAFSQLLKDQKFDAFITKMSPAEFKTYWESYFRVSALCVAASSPPGAPSVVFWFGIVLVQTLWYATGGKSSLAATCR